MQADSIFILALLAVFLGFVVIGAIRSRRQSSAAADAAPIEQPAAAAMADAETQPAPHRVHGRR